MKSTLNERFRAFYTEEFEGIIRKYKRPPLVAMMLKLIYALQLISLMFSIQIDKLIVSNSDKRLMIPVVEVLNCAKLFPLISLASSSDEENQLIPFIIISLIFNIIFLGYIAVRLILRLLRNESSKDMQKWAIYDDISSCYF